MGKQRPPAIAFAADLDLRDYVEALFLGTGPLSPANGDHGCSATGVVRGFSPGVVTMRVSTAMPPDRLAAVERVAVQAARASGGVVRPAIRRTADPDPMPGAREVTVAVHPEASSQGCPHDGGCAIHTFVDPSEPGAFEATRALLGPHYPPGSYAHEVGHALLGLCHVDGLAIGGAWRSAMSSGPGVYADHIAEALTPLDLAAARAVYEAGIRPGDGRDALVAAGLVNP